MLNELSVSDLKWISIAVVSFGSYFFGVLPNLLGLGNKYQNSLLLSSVLCFGGGVLFATSIVHILPDIRKDLSSWTELVFCMGYFLMYFVDVIVALTTQDKGCYESKHIKEEDVKGYGTMSEDTSLIVNIQPQVQECKTLSRIKCMDLSLLFAFTLHSLLEGLVIGVESTHSGVLLLLTAVCCHKLLVAFCLGAELSSGGKPLHAILPALTIFVAGSSVGIGLGIVLHPDNSRIVGKIAPVLQGLAGGTLLYVVVTEIIPRERMKKLPRCSSILQFISLCCGFIFMACLSAVV